MLLLEWEGTDEDNSTSMVKVAQFTIAPSHSDCQSLWQWLAKFRYKLVGGHFTTFDKEELRTAFAATSARSLPLIPIWLGIQHKVISFSRVNQLGVIFYEFKYVSSFKVDVINSQETEIENLRILQICCVLNARLYQVRDSEQPVQPWICWLVL